MAPSRLRHGDLSPVGASSELTSSGSGFDHFLSLLVLRNSPARPLSSGPSRYIVWPLGVRVAWWKSAGNSSIRVGSPKPVPPVVCVRVETYTRQPSLVLRLKY